MKRLASLCLIAFLAACDSPQDHSDAPMSDREMSLMHLAQNMQRSGDTGEAIRLYNQAIDKSGNRVQAHMALADLYNQMDKPEKATETLQFAKKRQKNHPLINLGLAKLAIGKNSPEAAVAYFDDGLSANANNVDLLNGKAVALDMVGQHQQAQELYYRAIDNHSGDADFIQNNLAMSFIMDGDYEQAISHLTAIDSMEKSPVMRQNLALAYGLKGDMRKARKWGLKDVSKKEFNENIKFYKNYSKELKKRQILE